MANEVIHIEKNTVQETLVIPLYGRKLCTELYPNLFRDERAVELISRLAYDFSTLEKQSKSAMHRFGALETAMRQNDLAIEVQSYLKTHPNAAVVNLGCGLDMTTENCDNGTCHIFNVDMPDVISVRNRLLPEDGRVRNISCDLNDDAWMEKIASETDLADGIILIAAGVFYYFKTDEIKTLFQKMEARFSGGVLVFDTAGERAVKLMLKTWVKEAGITSVSDYFSVDSIEKDLQPYFRSATVTSRGYMLGYNDLRDKSVPMRFRILAKIGDEVMRMRIVKVGF